MCNLYFSKVFDNAVYFKLFSLFAAFLIGCVFITINLLMADNVGAIVISGSDHFAFNNDVSNMTGALTNTSDGYGIPTSNIYSGNNKTFSDFQSAISQMNNDGVSELHIYISTHGLRNLIEFNDGLVSKNDFISAINQSSAPIKHVVLDSCYSRSFYNDLSESVGQDGTVITSTDENHESRYFFSSFFTSTLSNYMQDADSDLNQDGKVTYDEALSRLKTDGGWLPNLGHPKSASIPTLSEWKQIFLTLLMLSLVMGFMRKTHPTYNFSNGTAALKINDANLLAFDRQLFYSVLKWVGVVVILVFSGITVILGHVNMVDIIGTIFCAPLVAYILHLVTLFVRDNEFILK